jgi:hypothetical protein
MTVSGTTISLNSIYPDAYSNTFPNQESGHSSDKKENKKIRRTDPPFSTIRQLGAEVDKRIDESDFFIVSTGFTMPGQLWGQHCGSKE